MARELGFGRKGIALFANYNSGDYSSIEVSDDLIKEAMRELIWEELSLNN